MLADGENVSVRVFEPGDLVAARRSPDAAVLVLDEWVFFEDDVEHPLTRRTNDPMFIDLSTGCRHKS
jgi:hypothetical protein